MYATTIFTGAYLSAAPAISKIKGYFNQGVGNLKAMLLFLRLCHLIQIEENRRGLSLEGGVERTEMADAGSLQGALLFRQPASNRLTRFEGFWIFEACHWWMSA